MSTAALNLKHEDLNYDKCSKLNDEIKFRHLLATLHVLALESKGFLLPEKCFVIRSSDFTQWIWLIGFGTRLM